MGDYQARFCERLRVKLPLPTRRLGFYRHIRKKEMRHLFLTIIVILFATFCIATKEKDNRQTLLSDTTFVDFKPNRVVKTEQFLNVDSLNQKITKIEYYHDSIKVRETYRNYMTSEYDGAVNGDYYYYYNKNKRLIRRDLIEQPSCDTVRQNYRYPNNQSCNITVFDCRRRLKANMPHGDLITEGDKTTERIWLYDRTWTNTYNEKNKLIEYYEPIKDKSYSAQNRYTYKYENDKLIEENSFLNDTTLYYTEKFEYKDNEVSMNHVNRNLEKDNKWILPFYSEILKLDKNRNIVLIEKYDNKRTLMRKYINLYDKNNRLIKMKCFDGNNKLRVTHNLHYETLH